MTSHSVSPRQEGWTTSSEGKLSQHDRELSMLDDEHREYAVKRNRWPLILHNDFIECRLHGDVGHSRTHGWTTSSEGG